MIQPLGHHAVTCLVARSIVGLTIVVYIMYDLWMPAQPARDDAVVGHTRHTAHSAGLLLATSQPGILAHLVCKLLNEDQRSNEDVCILHVFCECSIVAGISQLFKQVTHNLNADVAAVGVDVLDSLCQS